MIRTIPQDEWKWHGEAGHFIASSACRFHLTTEIGKWRISTVGDYHPGDCDEMQPIGSSGFYETMVFELTGEPCNCDDLDCDMGVVGSWAEEDGSRYDTYAEAAKGHMEFCHMYSRVFGDE